MNQLTYTVGEQVGKYTEVVPMHESLFITGIELGLTKPAGVATR